MTSPSFGVPLFSSSPSSRLDAGALPAVAAPALESVAVTVPAPEPLTGEAVRERFFSLLRQQSPKRERAEGEALAAGDDVRLDLFALAGDVLVPFSIRHDFQMELKQRADLPGLFAGLTGKRVGDRFPVAGMLPVDYPVPGFRGCRVTYHVHVRAARQVTVPGPSPEVLERLGRGRTPDEIEASLLAELRAELEEKLVLRAQELVMERLAASVQEPLPRALVNEELRRDWLLTEGNAIAGRDFFAAIRDQALEAWLSDAATRADAERRLKLGLVLRAVVERDRLTLSDERLRAVLGGVGQRMGLPLARMRDVLLEDTALAERISLLAWHLVAVEHVMSRARVSFEPPRPSPASA